MEYTEAEILDFINKAKLNLNLLSLEIAKKESKGENVEKLYIQARLLSNGLYSLEHYNEYLLMNKTDIINRLNNYDEISNA